MKRGDPGRPLVQVGEWGTGDDHIVIFNFSPDLPQLRMGATWNPSPTFPLRSPCCGLYLRFAGRRFQCRCGRPMPGPLEELQFTPRTRPPRRDEILLNWLELTLPDPLTVELARGPVLRWGELVSAKMLEVEDRFLTDTRWSRQKELSDGYAAALRSLAGPVELP